MDTSDLWIEKYRPKTLENIIGSPGNVEAMTDWANTFKGGKKPHFPGLLLSGPPGTGKTSSAYTLANDYGWPIEEFNASDLRTHDIIMKEIAPLTMVATFQGGVFRKMILLDEVDALYTNAGKSDKGANKAINFILNHTKHPIVLTCNDIYEVPGNIKDMCVLVEWKKVRETTIRKLLLSILEKEGMSLNLDAVNSCIVKGDLRASINNLQIVSVARLPIEFSTQEHLNPFETMERIFKCTDPSTLDDVILNSELNPEEALLWIAENVTVFYTGLEVARAYEELSKADILMSNARKYGDFTYWGMAIRHMTKGVALAKIRPVAGGFKRTQFPSYLKKMSATKNQRKVLWSKHGLLMKLGGFFHMSAHNFMFTTFPLIQKICMNDLNYLLQLKLLLEFTGDEVAMLLDTSTIDPRVKRIMSREFKFSQETEAIIKRHEDKQKPLMDFFR